MGDLQRKRPPRWATWLLNILIPDGEWKTPVGDFEEYFQAKRESDGSLRAFIWYLSAVLGLIPRRVGNTIYWNTIMLKNYLKTSYRNLVRYKTYSAINLLGLTLGTACFLLISVYVAEERSFDSFHDDADRIHRVNVDFISETSTFSNALSAAPMGPNLQMAASGIESFTRIRAVRPEALIQFGDTRSYERSGYYADSTFLRVFSFPLMQGEADRVLIVPNSIVLTRSMAMRYFGLEDPVGQTLRMNNVADLTVTGVLQDVPQSSHFQFDFLISMSTIEPSLTSWFSNPYFTYMKLGPSVDPETVNQAAVPLVETYMEESARQAGVSVRLWIQPLLDIRLNPQNNDISNGRGATHLYLLTGIALFILLLACVNFINLATARSATRSKEVGMRKVIGAKRSQLIAQFLGESTMLAFLACGAGVFVAFQALPAFASLVGREVEMSLSLGLVGYLFATGALVSLVSGLYPALQLSRLQPIRILKSALGSGGRGKSMFRSSLVIFQFSVSVALIIVTGMVYRQLDFLKTEKLGLTTEQVIVLPVNQALADRAGSLKTSIGSIPGVESVAYSNRAPGTGAYGTITQRTDLPDDSIIETKYFFADNDLLKVLDIPLVVGRFFEPESNSEPAARFIINEQAVEDLGWESAQDALGQELRWSGDTEGQIIGVIEDFHFQPMTVHMQPVVMQYRESGQGALLVRLRTDDISTTMQLVEARWDEVASDWPFVVSFLDQDYDSLYRSEEQFGKIFSTFSLLALMIACLGLFGLATFAVQQRTRELGIRKALGATGGGIAVLLSKEFTILVLVANVLAWPAAYFFLDNWLGNFPFRTTMAWWIFVLAGGMALAIAILAVSSQAIRASRTNPVEALRLD